MEGISEVQGKRKKTRPPRGAARRSIHSHPHSHPLEVRRKAVQLYLEEGLPAARCIQCLLRRSFTCFNGMVR